MGSREERWKAHKMAKNKNNLLTGFFMVPSKNQNQEWAWYYFNYLGLINQFLRFPGKINGEEFQEEIYTITPLGKGNP